jgi:hypothetical protein
MPDNSRLAVLAVLAGNFRQVLTQPTVTVVAGLAA